MSYSFHFNQPGQTRPIEGRESEMVRGRSGGYAFAADVWQQLRRCLIIGTASSTYYASKQELTKEFVGVVKKAIALDPRRVADEILYASNGNAINNSAPIFTLVLLSCSESDVAKKSFKEIFLQVVRTGSHFYEWLSYTKSTRGMGKLVKKAGLAWLNQDDVRNLTYQFLKYQQRHGYSAADALRLFKPVAQGSRQNLFSWVINGWQELPDLNQIHPENEQIWWFEWLKRNPNQGAIAVRDGRLTMEMVTGIANMNKEVWTELFLGMPTGALLRNLGSLTEIGVLYPQSELLSNLKAKLTSKAILRKARIHPLDVLKALKVYESGGRIGKSKKTWEPVPQVNVILNLCLQAAFEAQEPTGKTFMHAIDVSASMSCPVNQGAELTCAEIATAMALATVKAEENFAVWGFSNTFVKLNIQKTSTFEEALAVTRSRNFGSTDASLAFQWALKNKAHVDVFCLWTDNESFAGDEHPSVALKKYRDEINPEARAVYISLAPYNITQIDPADVKSYEIGGFDPSTPKYIQMIAKGEV